MNHEALAWVEFTERAPPHGTMYATLARFSDEPTDDDHPYGQWTLVIDFGSGQKSPRAAVRVRFLSDDAPHDLLAAGSRFELFEGARAVAYGEILGVVSATAHDKDVLSDPSVSPRTSEHLKTAA